jgi:hypothetical protein
MIYEQPKYACVYEYTKCKRGPVLQFAEFSWVVFQSGRVRDAAWGSDWIGAPVSHMRSVRMVMTVSKEFTLTAGKIIPVSRRTMMVVWYTSDK